MQYEYSSSAKVPTSRYQPAPPRATAVQGFVLGASVVDGRDAPALTRD